MPVCTVMGIYRPICVKFGTGTGRSMPPHFGIFCMNNTRSNMIVVRNCGVGDFAPLLVFLLFFFLSFLQPPNSSRVSNGNSVFEEA
jgi:hypothetical protein